ncbi:pseudouridine synthase family protein [Leucothrix arctica]|uniref:RNA pseudouridine synthase n=1 Tax=Leucothrix arctica TaxID=1481894 RepID=A0A317CLU7_9GAMM|nr:RNA pseudouridine synthase [Leucothrix arctica]PWQ97270.1 RNA pseudouridine synthase [Leucothrix arctica]
MSEPIEHHISTVTDDQLAIDCLAEATGISKQKLKMAMQKGCVWLEKKGAGKHYTQRLRRAKRPLSLGETLHIYYDLKVLTAVPPSATLISDEGAYSIWNKPSGMLSQGSKWGDHCTIYRWAEQNLQPERPAFIVHRLDRAANGLIVLAHKKQVAAQFSKMFEEHQLEKHYRATVTGNFSTVMDGEGNIDSLIGKTKTIRDNIDDKSACSHITLLSYDDAQDESTVDVLIESGRKHQIRKHLSGAGFPIIGDRLYGAPEKLDERDLQLRAHSLAFNCPVTDVAKYFEL